MHIQEDDFNKGSQNNRKWGKDNLSNKLKKKKFTCKRMRLHRENGYVTKSNNRLTASPSKS